MPLQHNGNNGVIDEVDTKHRANRMSLRPHDVGSLGGYRLTALSGQIAATLAAAAPLFAFRWTDATRKCVLTELQVGIVVDGTISIAVPIVIEAVEARSWSVVDSGGTALTITGNNGKVQTDMGTTLVGDARMATTGALTPGTRTLDTQGFGLAVGGSGTTAGLAAAIGMTGLYRPIAGVEHPVVFAQNEGFIIRSVLTGPASGTFRLAVMAAWSEMASFNNAGQ